MADDPRQIASADDLERRYGVDSFVFARVLARHEDADVRAFWSEVLDILTQRTLQ